MKLSAILNQCKTSYKLINPHDLSILGITCNSKRVRNNYIFSCIKGKKYCGTFFIKDFIEEKKVIILTDNSTRGMEYLDDEIKKTIPIILTNNVRKLTNEILNIIYPSSLAETIAVTGTNGKTSVADYTRQIWHKNNFNCFSFGTLGIFQNSKRIAEKNLTTFDSETLFKSLRRISKMGGERLIIEASSIGIDQNRMYPIKFNKIGITNLTHDHLDYHKTFRNYKNAKAKLFRYFSCKSTIAVLNADDRHFEFFKKICIEKEILFLDYGYNAAFLKIIDIDIKRKNIFLTLKIKEEELKIVFEKISIFDIYNRLCAIIFVYGDGLDKSKFSVLRKLVSPPGRLEKIYDKNFTVYIDYAHTPDALEKTLESLKNIGKNNIISLIGCGGNRDYEKRPLMTKVALKFSSLVIIADDNPRNEDPKKIRDDMIYNLNKNERKKIKNVGDRKKAIKQGIEILKRNDIFVIFGKGHERFQLIKDKKIPFSDSKTVLKIVQGL